MSYGLKFINHISLDESTNILNSFISFYSFVLLQFVVLIKNMWNVRNVTVSFNRYILKYVHDILFIMIYRMFYEIYFIIMNCLRVLPFFVKVCLANNLKLLVSESLSGEILHFFQFAKKRSSPIQNLTQSSFFHDFFFNKKYLKSFFIRESLYTTFRNFF